MIKRLILATIWFLSSGAILWAQTNAESPVSSTTGGRDVAGRSWTPQDSVGVRYFYPDAIKVSPDGAHFFFVTVRGDLSCDCDVWELSVFATDDVRHALLHREASQGLAVRALQTLRRSSGGGTYTLAIWDPTWEPDGKAISFEDVSEKGGQQLYLFQVRSGVVTPLTHNTYDMDSIWHTRDTTVSNLWVPIRDTSSGYPMHAITIAELTNIGVAADAKRRITSFVSYRGGPAWEISNTDFCEDSPFIWFSPDGRRAITLRSPKAARESWTYDGLLGLPEYGNGTFSDFPQFALIDAEHGHSEPLFDAPAAWATKVGRDEDRNGVRADALWATDQRHVILVNTELPIVPGGSSERKSMSYIVGYNADSGRWVEIEPLVSQASGALRIVAQVGWLVSGKTLLVRHTVAGQAAAGTVYQLKGDQWIGRAVPATVRLPEPPKPPALGGGLSITVRQSANDPPVLVASEGGHELALTAPDPALEGIWRARQEPFQWREPSGRLEIGGLLLPRGVEKSGTEFKLPLVIQSYEYSADHFNPDGIDDAHHAYAAQALVARGMAVLNMDIPAAGAPPRELATPRELTEFSERVTSAAQALAKTGLIDLSRVGLIGFSRAGLNTYYAITHPGEEPPAAAVIDDAFTGTYAGYLDAEATSRLGHVAYDPLYGGDFWHHKASWLESEATFNLDRVETPVLFTIHSERALPHASVTIGAFQLNNRPIEYLLFPMASHNLHKPRQRLVSYEASVDWMSFWLQGYEDPDPAKTDQYRRWRVIKANWVKQKAWEAAGHPAGSTPDAEQPPESKKN